MPKLDDRLDAFFERLAHRLTDHRAAVLVATFVLAAVLGASARGLTVNTTNEYMFTPGDPLLERFEDFKEQFGSNEFLYVLLRVDDLFTPGALHAVDRMATALEQGIPYVREVTSILDVEHIETRGDEIEVGPLIGRDAIPDDPAAAAALRERAFSRPEYTEVFVTPDATHTGIVVDLVVVDESIEGDYRKRVAAAADRVISDPAFASLEPRVVGPPILDAAMDNTIVTEGRMFGAVAVGLMITILIVLFRRPIDVVSPLLVVVLTNVSLLGCMALAGIPITMMSSILPALVMVVGVCDAIHVLSEYRQQIVAIPDRRVALYETLRRTGLPCLFTSLTTMVGFGSLMAMDLRPGREMGVFAAVGVVIAFVLTFLLLPPLLTFGSTRRIERATGSATGRAQRRLLEGVASVATRYPRAILVVAGALTVLAAVGITRIRVEAHFIEMFDESTRVRVDYEHVESTLGGSVTLEALVDARAEGGVFEPEVLTLIDELEGWLREQPQTRSTFSVAGVVQDMNEALNEGDPAHHRVPESRELAAQLFLLYETGGAEEVDRLVSNERDVAHVTARFAHDSTTAFQGLSRGLEAWALDHAGTADVVLTGQVPIFVELLDNLTRSQLRSFGVAFVAVAVMMVLLFRSLKLGLLAMVPNLAPVVGALGYMGWAGITLNFGTVMIASIAIGIAVDDTIHYTSHFRRHRAEGMSTEEAIRATTTGVGLAMLITSVVIALGFSIFSLSTFAHLVNFGSITALTVALALVADFFVLPALLLVVDAD